jgi:hypothetical protein
VDLDATLRLAIYRHFVETSRPPTIDHLARVLDVTPHEVRGGWQRLAARRAIVLDGTGESIRMALPFSAVETQHRVRTQGRTYFANCAWDSFGIPAALHSDAEVLSRCEQTQAPLHLRIGADTPPPELVRPGTAESSSWFFHAAVPAAHWWRDIVYT